jgi:hypothetical protein
VRRIQDMRKKADFKIEDRISTWYQAEGDLAEVFQRWGEYIANETLTTSLQPGTAAEGAYVESHEVEKDMFVTLAVRQNR